MNSPFKSIVAACSLAILVAACGSMPSSRPAAQMAQQDLTTLGVAEAAAMIRERKITSEALTRALIAKANAGKSLNAFITLDEAAAIKAAQEADAMTAAGKSGGALHGVPIAI